MTAQRILVGIVLFGVPLMALVPSVARGQVPGLAAPPLPPQAAGTGVVASTPFATGTGHTDTLTAPPGLPPGDNLLGGQSTMYGLTSPAGCCWPVGADGPVTYELFLRTGPTWIIGGGNELAGASRFGWSVHTGGRTLLFNPTQDAAWAAEVGLRYAYNGADNNRVFDVFERQPAPINPQTGQPLGPQPPDVLVPFRLRGQARYDVTWAVGRDYFLNGPGTAPGSLPWNTRIGWDVGGRWGNIRADLLPVAVPESFSVRNIVTHSLTAGFHWDAEIPFGPAILFSGIRIEYGHTWSNVAPPQDGNIQDLGILLTLGARF